MATPHKASLPADAESLPVPLCAIGASAGGVTALQHFFSKIGVDLGVAFVVVIHLAPDSPSQLTEILATRTPMPVHQVENDTRIEPNCVYVIPPDRELIIRGDDIVARPFSEPRGKRTPIDMLFRSVAAARRDGLAVVLSGSGSDGALGARAIKEAGGVVFVQDPAEAEYAMMPRSAIATGAVDFIAPLDQLPIHISEIVHNKDAAQTIIEKDGEQAIQQIIGFVRARTGHDFSYYKRATIMRRIARRMQVTRQNSLIAYNDYLRANPEEAKDLFSDLLISVTMFFRDREAFAALEERVVRPLFEKLEGNAPIRIWVVGCATGEEAYSIAILMLEEGQRRGVRPSIQIFASDIDEAALAAAREGRYLKAIETDVTEERLRTFFVEDSEHYRIRKEVRDLVLFASHNVLKDPPFVKLDLISCRNLLIYLQRELQHQLCDLFHYALKPDGFLFLGSAETVDSSADLFSAIDRDARLYTATASAERAFPTMLQLPSERHFGPLHSLSVRTDPPVALGHIHAAALEQSSPPSVLVDESYRTLHLSPTASRFFLASEGPFSFELPAQVRSELRIDLKLALQRAFEQSEPTLTPPIRVAFNGSARLVSMQVTPFAPEMGATPRAVVFFLDGGKAPSPDESADNKDIGQEEAKRLREALALAQNQLGASRKEHDLAIQELRAANEELQSMNEEYRSTAEELETSKEELQSMNEELQTVNAELKSKLQTISSAHNDLQNLMGATEIGTLFLDPDLKIKLFTPAVANHFSITEADIGRSISDFTHKLAYDNVEHDAIAVLKSLVPSEKEVTTKDGHWLTVRMRPYRTIEDRINGVVVTFMDITSLKQIEDALAKELHAMTRLQALSIKVVECGDLDTLLKSILDTAMELLGADFGAIQLYDSDSRMLRVAVQRGLEQRFLDYLTGVDGSERSTGGIAAGASKQLQIEDVENEPALTASLQEARAAKYRAAQSTPLLTNEGKPLGMLSTYFREPRKFSEHDLWFANFCAHQASDIINVHNIQKTLVQSEKQLRHVLVAEQKRAAGQIFELNTELEGAALYTRSLIEASVDPLVTISAEGKIMDVNESTVQAIGVPRDTLIGSDFSAYFTEPEKARAAYQGVFATGSMKDYPLTLRHASGTLMDVLYNANVYRNKEGEAAGVFAAARDITKRKQAEEQVLKLNAELKLQLAALQDANKELASLSYSVSHDLKIPLRAIDGYCVMLQEEIRSQPGEEARRHLDVIRQSAAHMAKLIDGILEFFDMYRRLMKISAVDMHAEVSQVFEDLQAGKPEHQVALKLGELPPACGDREMIRLILRNLLNNAFKFTAKQNSPEIEVGGTDEGTETAYWIKDNGVGFDPRFAHKLFGVSMRLHSSEEFGGLGFGLAIVKRVIDRHGGHISAQSQEGEGATFRFTLPKQGDIPRAGPV